MKLFLSHRIDHFGFLDPYYLGLSEDGKIEKIDIKGILRFEDEIITYELPILLDQLRFEYEGELPILTDISQIFKLNTGRSKRSYPPNQTPWNFWNRIKFEIGDEHAIKLYKKIRSSIVEEEVFKALEELAHLLRILYYKSIKVLIKSNQFSRFYELENRIQQILNRRQVEGLFLDLESLNELIKELEAHKDLLIHKLRYKHKITDLNFKSLQLQLVEKGYHIANKDDNYFSLVSFLKSAKINSPLCDDLYNALRVKFDFESLSQYIPEQDNIVFPVFDCIGTVTSRILILSPHIQQLKRENRKIFKAKENYTLLYCDYNQFEPGILASFSKDKDMLELYNSEDIYENFSNYIFGTKTLRKEAKTIFLSYLYGMSDKNLVSSIEKIIKSKRLSNSISVADFFSNFKNLEKFKNRENELMVKNGFIQSETTLLRYVNKTKIGKGKQSEKRFVLSQIIQGTASYILKNAILDSMEDKEIDFLIPMHDAVLFQVPAKKSKEKKDFIEKCFVENFKKTCPDINAKVDFKNFDE